MTLSLSIATIAWFSKNFTLWSYDYDTFQPKIGQCVCVTVCTDYEMRLNDLNCPTMIHKIQTIVKLKSRSDQIKAVAL